MYVYTPVELYLSQRKKEKVVSQGQAGDDEKARERTKLPSRKLCGKGKFLWRMLRLVMNFNSP